MHALGEGEDKDKIAVTHGAHPVITGTEIRVDGAGGAGSSTNGLYRIHGLCNKKVKFVQEVGTAILFYDGYWKISATEDTSTWLYSVESATGDFPPGGLWTTYGYEGDESAEPPPTVKKPDKNDEARRKKSKEERVGRRSRRRRSKRRRREKNKEERAGRRSRRRRSKRRRREKKKEERAGRRSKLRSVRAEQGFGRTM